MEILLELTNKKSSVVSETSATQHGISVYNAYPFDLQSGDRLTEKSIVKPYEGSVDRRDISELLGFIDNNENITCYFVAYAKDLKEFKWYSLKPTVTDVGHFIFKDFGLATQEESDKLHTLFGVWFDDISKETSELFKTEI